MGDIERRIVKLEERNRKVESDKAWEVSWERKLLLLVFTYLSVALYLWAIEIENPWMNAIVPAVAFLISTLTLPWFKKIWLNRIKK